VEKMEFSFHCLGQITLGSEVNVKINLLEDSKMAARGRRQKTGLLK
jgi:hypothetical protein